MIPGRMDFPFNWTKIVLSAAHGFEVSKQEIKMALRRTTLG